jgi:hypothetical protein
MRPFPLLGAAFMGVSVCAGCTATHVAYVHNATLGVDLTLAAQGTARFSLGYDRETFAIVPRKRATKPAEAMTLTAFSKVAVRGLDDVHFSHVIATGEAAKSVAKDSQLLERIGAEYFQGNTPPEKVLENAGGGR